MTRFIAYHFVNDSNDLDNTQNYAEEGIGAPANSLPSAGDVVYADRGSQTESGQLQTGTWMGGIDLLTGSTLTVDLFQDYYDYTLISFPYPVTPLLDSGNFSPTTIEAGATLTATTFKAFTVKVYGTLNATTVTNDTGSGETQPGFFVGTDSSNNVSISIFAEGVATIGSTTAGTFSAGVSGTLTSTGDLNLGGGTLNVNSGGQAFINGSIGIGRSSGDIGSVIINGAGSQLTYSGGTTFTVGDAGTGAFIVQAGADENLPQGSEVGDVIVGAQATSKNNNLKVVAVGSSGQTPASSSLKVHHLVLADAGTALFSISGGSKALVTGNFTAGNQIGAEGDVAFTGLGSVQGQFNYLAIVGNAIFGNAGASGTNGASNFSAGAVFSVQGTLTLGAMETGFGSLIVTDQYSSCTVGGTMTIGDAGSGSLTVEKGAAVNNSGTPGNVVIAKQQGAAGSLRVTGSNTTMSAASLAVGEGGNGTLEVDSGGSLNTSSNMTMGGPSGSASVTSRGSLYVTGELDIADTANSVASMTVDGEFSHLNISGNLNVGQFGTGELDVKNGGTYHPGLSQVLIGTGDLAIGVIGRGTVKVDGTGSNLVARHNVTVGSTGTLTASNNGLVLIDGEMTLGAGSNVSATTGTIEVGGNDLFPNNNLDPGTFFVQGHVVGSGTISAAFITDAGMGSIEAAAGGVLNLQSSGESNLEHLSIDPTATLELGRLDGGGSIVFNGNSGKLKLDNPGAGNNYYERISLLVGDTIELTGKTVQSVSLIGNFTTYQGHNYYDQPGIAITDTSGTVYQYTLSGIYTDPQFTIAGSDVTLSSGSHSTVASDFTGTGTSDVLWINPANEIVGDWLMNQGTPTWQVVGQGSSTVSIEGIGDFAGNGTSNILWENPSNGLVGDWLMSNNQPTWQQIGQGSTNMNIAGVGDFNGDGTDDILWWNPTNNLVGEWQMNNNVPTWQLVGQGSATMNIAGIGDFNGDHTDDILWENPTNNLVGMWAMNGSTASWSLVAQGSTTMQIVGVGDFIGSGTDDVLWENPSNGTVGFWGMNNGQVTSWNVVANANTSYQVAGIGDYCGNGTDDILWRNPSTGDTGIWQMNNGQATWHDLGIASTTVNPVKA